MFTLVRVGWGSPGKDSAVNAAGDNELCSGFPWIVNVIQREIVLIGGCFENIGLTAFELYNIIIGVNNTPLS